MKTKQIFLLIVLVNFIVACGVSKKDSLLTNTPKNNIVNPEGTKDSGGDPYAQEFVKKALRLALYFMENPGDGRYSFSPLEFEALAKKYDQSLKDENIPDLIVMTRKMPVDKFGIEKSAVINEETGLIKVYRRSWENFGEKERYTQVAMELFKILKVKNRYELAESVVDKALEYLKHANENSYGSPYYVNNFQKDGINFKLDVDDLVIDGGIFLTGSKLTEAGIEFLKNPSSQPEVFKAIMAAFQKNKIVYIAFQGAYRSAKVLVGLDTVLKGGKILLSSRTVIAVPSEYEYFKPIQENSLCSDQSTALTLRQRLMRCYSQNTHRSISRDNDSGIVSFFEKEMGTTLEENYAVINEALNKALSAIQNNLSYHYYEIYKNGLKLKAPTKAFRVTYHEEISNAMPVASGLWPNLTQKLELNEKGDGPATLPYWSGSNYYSPRDLRLIQAAKFLEENHLHYEDSNISCNEVKSANLPGFKGPIFLKEEVWEKYKNTPCMSYKVNLGPLSSFLFDQMVEKGWIYDFNEQKWIEGKLSKDEADNPRLEIRKVTYSPMIEFLEFKYRYNEKSNLPWILSSEVLTRIKTEHMSSKQRVLLVLKQVEGLEIDEKAEYFRNILNNFFRFKEDKEIPIKEEDKNLVFEKIHETLKELVQNKSSFEENDEFLEALIGSLSKKKITENLAKRTIFLLKSLNSDPIIVRHIVSSLGYVIRNKKSTIEDNPYIFELAKIAFTSDAFTNGEAKEIAKDIDDRQNGDYETGYFYINEKKDPLSFEMLNILLKSNKLNKDFFKEVQAQSETLKEINLWKKDLEKTSSSEEKTIVTLKALEKSPLNLTPQVLLFAAKKEINLEDKKKIALKILDLFKDTSFKDFEKTTIPNLSNPSYKENVGILNDFWSFFANTNNLGLEIDKKIVEFIFEKEKDVPVENKERFLKQITYSVNHKWTRTSPLTEKILFYINEALTSDTEVNREICEELVEAYTFIIEPFKNYEYDYRDRRDGLKNSLVDPRPTLKAFSENPYINPEYRERFEKLLERMPAPEEPVSVNDD